MEVKINKEIRTILKVCFWDCITPLAATLSMGMGYLLDLRGAKALIFHKVFSIVIFT